MPQPSYIDDHSTADAHSRPEPLGAGLFGQRGTIEAHIAENRAEAGDLPSLDEFEDHYGQVGVIVRKSAATA